MTGTSLTRTRRLSGVNLRARAGFTFVELLMVGSVVFVLINGITFMLAEAGKQVWERTDVRMATMADAQRALDRISEDLRAAHQANLACIQTVVAPSCTNPPCLAFDPSAIGAARVTYQRDTAGNLLRGQGTGSQVISGGLSAFNSTCQADGIVRLSVTARVTTPNGPSSRTLDSQVWVQNP